MTARSSARLAWSLWAIHAAATITFLYFGTLNGEGENAIINFPVLFAFTAFATIGALLISRYPRHPIGWIFMTIGLGTALGNLTQQYAIYTLFIDRDSSLPGGVASAWFGGWLWVASAGVIVFLPLLLPDGRLPSPRWKPAIWTAAIAIVVIVAVFAFKPGPLDIGEEYPVSNPLGIKGSGEWLDTIQSWAAIAFLVILAAAMGSLVVRARRSTGVERQQLKWFGYACVFMTSVLFVLQPAISKLLPEATGDTVNDFLFGLAVAAIPGSAGVAIFRYRLYDIDLIINRTLVYGLLTAILAGIYLGIVVLVQLLITGGGRAPPAVVAGSTLAVAALFRPIRSRIQSFIDRRFNRRRYDAARTIELFSAQLRDEVDLDSLKTDLLQVVGETMEPARLSLWLKPNR
jgi:hypothetical protein